MMRKSGNMVGKWWIYIHMYIYIYIYDEHDDDDDDNDHDDWLKQYEPDSIEHSSHRSALLQPVSFSSSHALMLSVLASGCLMIVFVPIIRLLSCFMILVSSVFFFSVIAFSASSSYHRDCLHHSGLWLAVLHVLPASKIRASVCFRAGLQTTTLALYRERYRATWGGTMQESPFSGLLRFLLPLAHCRCCDRGACCCSEACTQWERQKIGSWLRDKEETHQYSIAQTLSGQHRYVCCLKATMGPKMIMHTLVLCQN